MSQGRDAEEIVIGKLRANGYPVEPFGQALLSAQARNALRETKSLIRWLPDLFIPGSRSRAAVTIDAKSCSTKYSNHSIEMRSLACARDIVELPVFYICPDGHAITAATVLEEGPDRVCCDRCWNCFLHDFASLPERCPTYVARGGLSGSKTPFVLVSKVRHRSAGDFFPPIGSVQASQQEIA